MATNAKRGRVLCALPSTCAGDREIAAIILRAFRSTPGRMRLRRTDPGRVDDDIWPAIGIVAEAAFIMERGEVQPYVDRQWERYGRRWAPPPNDALSARIDDVATALRFGPAEKDVLRLALITNRSEAVRAALDFVGKPDRDIASIVLGAAIGRAPGELRGFFNASWPLVRTKVVRGGAMPREDLSTQLALADGFAEALSHEDATLEQMLRSLFRPSPPAKLTREDCPHLEREIALLATYLPCLDRDRQRGVNFLIHGAPGTGKTEFVRFVAAELGLAMFEVPTESADGDPLDSGARFGAYWACQRALASRHDTAVLFDEVEDVFPAGRHGRSGFFAFLIGSAEGGPRKAWVNEILETNAVPAFWLCNAIDQLDPAYVRRFDAVIEMRSPTRAVRRRLVDRFLGDLPVDEEVRSALSDAAALAPGHLERMARVVRASGAASATGAAQTLRFLADGTLRALRQKPLSRASVAALRYRPELLNANADLNQIVAGLRSGRGRGARLCLFGPPGTGKSAWAAHLAQQIDRPLVRMRGSDLLSMWVGQTEQLIAAAFEEATREQAVLLIDEADTFLGDRRHAQRSWEVSQVNELLTQMEDYEGVFIASTNLVDNLDAAALRRFDFKIRFDYLLARQRIDLFLEALSTIGASAAVDEAAARDRLERMVRLTPGDFANVLRQVALGGVPISGMKLLDLLAQECKMKTDRVDRPIGFSAA